MPGALHFLHALDDAPVLMDDVVRGNFGACGRQAVHRHPPIGHAGVVQHDHVRLATVAALTVVGGRNDVGNDGGIRDKRHHGRQLQRRQRGAPTEELVSRGNRYLGHATGTQNLAGTCRPSYPGHIEAGSVTLWGDSAPHNDKQGRVLVLLRTVAGLHRDRPARAGEPPVRQRIFNATDRLLGLDKCRALAGRPGVDARIYICLPRTFETRVFGPAAADGFLRFVLSGVTA